jgi:CHAT domain-containing protein/tetratricopeptide (TPR) repeat protein
VAARDAVQRYQALLRLPEKDRREVVQSYRAAAEGAALTGRHKYRAAEGLHRQALALRRKVLGEEHFLTASSYSWVASNLDAQGKYAEAQPLYEKALTIRRKALGEDHPDTATSYNNVAFNLNAQGKHAEAQPLNEKALAISRKALGEDHPHTAQSYNNVAANLDDQGKHAEAQPLYEKALAIRRKALGEDHPDTAASYNNVAANLWQQHEIGRAVRLLQASLPGQEAVRFHGAASGFDRAIASGERASPQVLLALGLAHLKQPHDAFRHAEASLARGLLDDLAAASADHARQIASLRAQLDRLDRQLLPLFGRAALPAEQKAAREGMVRQRRQALAGLARLAAEVSSRQLLPLADIQKHLPADAALVLWLDDDTLGEHRACIVRPRGDPVWVQLPGRGAGGAWTIQDRELPDRLYALLRQPDAGEAERRRLSAALARQRLEPLRPHLGAGDGLPAVRRLLVVPTGWAGVVPLEVLGTGYRISYVPSGSVYARLVKQHRAVAGPSLLALGDPAFTEASPEPRGAAPAPLPGTRGEVRSLGRLVPGATALLGSDASEQRLDDLARDGKLKTFRLVHLATHGLVDWQTPGRSRLLLARDRLPDPLEQARSGRKVYTGELTVAAIRQSWKLDADLVVLSACRTALGRDGGGDGLLGFAQAFLQCGARCVVLSRWEADDTATALLMLRFYENVLGSKERQDLKGPLPRAEALEEAKRWLRELPRRDAQALAAALQGDKLGGTVTRGTVVELDVRERPVQLPAGERPYAHPFYWATFVLVGDPD